jgi:NAD+ synthase
VTVQDADNLCSWIKEKLGNRNAVVGISGGIDSSVIAALCVRAVGKNRTILVSLPCGEDKDKEYTDLLLKTLNYTHFIEEENLLDTRIDIEKACANIHYALRDALGCSYSGRKVAYANIQARMRMIVLYAIANTYNGIVVGTTNKSEYEIGYATKYGDAGVDIEPIQDFYKSEVRELGTLLGLSEMLVNRTPTAGLWEGQTDESEIGMTYDELDSFLKGNAGSIEKAKRVRELQEMSEHKRNPIPFYRRIN